MHTQSTVFQDRKRPVLDWDDESYLDYEECDSCGKHRPPAQLGLYRGFTICDDCFESAEEDAKNAYREKL